MELTVPIAMGVLDVLQRDLRCTTSVRHQEPPIQQLVDGLGSLASTGRARAPATTGRLPRLLGQDDTGSAIDDDTQFPAGTGNVTL